MVWFSYLKVGSYFENRIYEAVILVILLIQLEDFLGSWVPINYRKGKIKAHFSYYRQNSKYLTLILWYKPALARNAGLELYWFKKNALYATIKFDK